MNCSQCGFGIKGDATFCASCGTRVAPQQQNNQPTASSPSIAATDSKAEWRGGASLVMGILSLVLSWVSSVLIALIIVIGMGAQIASTVIEDHGTWSPAFTQYVTSSAFGLLLLGLIPAIILGALAISNGNNSRRVPYERNNKFWVALAGIVTGSIGLAFSIFYIIWFIMMAGAVI